MLGGSKADHRRDAIIISLFDCTFCEPPLFSKTTRNRPTGQHPPSTTITLQPFRKHEQDQQQTKCKDFQPLFASLYVVPPELICNAPEISRMISTRVGEAAVKRHFSCYTAVICTWSKKGSRLIGKNQEIVLEIKILLTALIKVCSPANI